MIDLAAIRDGAAAGVDLLALKANRSLTLEVQTRLSNLGLLDPPADGDFGPVSEWAWKQFCAHQGAPNHHHLTANLARSLLALDAGQLFTLELEDELASRVVRTMLAEGYWLARHPKCINIAYLEGIDATGERNDNPVDRYNDLRCVVSIRDGKPVMLGAWTATTQPGWHWILNPDPDIQDPVKAAAHIALGQYKAWVVGTHNGSTSHEALVQRAKIKVHRDRDRNGRREGDPVFERADYGINQHHGNNSTVVGRYSAGCLVGNSVNGHREFMTIVKSDARYRASNGYRFMTSVIGAGELLD